MSDYLEESLKYERGKDLFEFPYDWRQDCRLATKQLAKAIESWKISPPVVIIAHSMGSLVSRYYVERLGGKRKVSRMIFVGRPHYGVPKGLMTLLFGPKLLPFGLLGERLREVISSFTSIYQLLPIYSCADFLPALNPLTLNIFFDAKKFSRTVEQQMGQELLLPWQNVHRLTIKSFLRFCSAPPFSS